MADWDQLHSKARSISEEMKHFFLGTEHLFMAALETESWLASLLSRSGADLEKFSQRVWKIAEKGDGAPLWEGFPVTPRTKCVLEAAKRDAAEAGLGKPLAGHVVAAILREGRGIPARALEEMDIDLVSLRQEVARELKRGAGRPQPGGAERMRGQARQMEGMSGMLGEADVIDDPDQRGGKGAPIGTPAAGKEGGKQKKSVLDEYGRNLVLEAREGRMDPVIGRNDEIRRCLQILTRKIKNNPVLIGEAGVGKSSVAFGLAQRIATGRVPDALQQHEVWEISMNRLVAGAAYRGEFQDRLQKVMDEVAKRSNIILFIDEIHMLMGAGDSKGGMDAGNILKPALARGEFPVIGATTTDEYRKSIESDPALERRFQPVLVNEPSEAECLQILEGLRPQYEQHHEVTISDAALRSAIKLSTRFLPDRNLPDKAIDLIDEASSLVKMGPISASMTPESASHSLEVGEQHIAEVVSKWSGVPVGMMTEEESKRLLHMEEFLQARVIGQDHAVHAVAQTIKVMRVGFGNPSRPGGVFMFLGPTGVGKTELARSLAEFLFGSEKDMVRIDMSEYMEKHAISRLIGSPPGYVGHEEEGQLTSAVRTRPYSVVLLDEVEKAHSDVWDLFLQVFDDGRLTDSKGRTVNFTNTVIILTSNVGTRPDGSMPADPDDPACVEFVQDALRKRFRPEFLNRIDEFVHFKPLDRAALEKILDLQITEVAKRIRETRGLALALEPTARRVLLDKGYSPAYGARPLKRAVQTMLVKPFAEEVLRADFKSGDIVSVDAQGDRLVFRQASFGGDDDLGDEYGDGAQDGAWDDDMSPTRGPSRGPQGPPAGPAPRFPGRDEPSPRGRGRDDELPRGRGWDEDASHGRLDHTRADEDDELAPTRPRRNVDAGDSRSMESRVARRRDWEDGSEPPPGPSERPRRLELRGRDERAPEAGGPRSGEWGGSRASDVGGPRGRDERAPEAGGPRSGEWSGSRAPDVGGPRTGERPAPRSLDLGLPRSSDHGGPRSPERSDPRTGERPGVRPADPYPRRRDAPRWTPLEDDGDDVPPPDDDSPRDRGRRPF